MDRLEDLVIASESIMYVNLFELEGVVGAEIFLYYIDNYSDTIIYRSMSVVVVL